MHRGSGRPLSFSTKDEEKGCEGGQGNGGGVCWEQGRAIARLQAGIRQCGAPAEDVLLLNKPFPLVVRTLDAHFKNQKAHGERKKKTQENWELCPPKKSPRTFDSLLDAFWTMCLCTKLITHDLLFRTCFPLSLYSYRERGS